MTPPLPTDLGQLAQWLILPVVLVAIANFIISTWFANQSPQRQGIVKLGVFVAIGLLSYGLTLLPPDVIAKIEPLWSILASVIAAYFAVTVVKQVWFGLQLLGLRLLLGRDAFAKHVTVTELIKVHTVRGVPVTTASATP